MGIWVRMEQHVATYSNHCEGFHSGMKKRNESNSNFQTRLSNLMKKKNHRTYQQILENP